MRGSRHLPHQHCHGRPLQRRILDSFSERKHTSPDVAWLSPPVFEIGCPGSEARTEQVANGAEVAHAGAHSRTNAD